MIHEPRLRPSDYHADLNDEYLAELATFFCATRSRTVASHDAAAGDDSWSLGCRAFARCRNLLNAKAASKEWDWLTILNPGKRFIFAIGSVPVRFYRGSYADAPRRTLAESPEELRQLSLAFPLSKSTAADLKWRFAIETDCFGEPSAVIFAGLAKEDGSPVCHWEIPFDGLDQEIALPVVNIDDMIELAPPKVGAVDSRRSVKNGG
jgi:hypothetical protein